MSATVAAALEVDGSAIRYAEVEQGAGSPTVLRLGQQTLDFDVKAHALEADDDEATSTVAAVVANALPEARAEHATIVIHPAEVCSFFTPVPADLSGPERKRQVVRQVALLSGARSLEGLHVRVRLAHGSAAPSADAEDAPTRWLHVLLIPDAMHERMGRLLQSLPVVDYDWMLSTEAAAHLMGRMDLADLEEKPTDSISVAVGQYAEHTEYTIVQGDAWVHDHHTRAVDTAQDRLYHLVTLLNRLQIPLERVRRLYVYGRATPNDYGTFRAVFPVTPERLRPTQVVAGWPDAVDPSTDALYVPCVGGAL